MLSKEREAMILRLYHAEGWRVNTIARQLGVHHTTVQRVLAQAGVPSEKLAARPSMVEPYVPFIVETLTNYPRLCASRVFEMVRKRGYPGGPDHFRRVVARLRPRRPAEAFLRLRTLPGEQAQVDWAHFGKVRIGSALRVLWAFVMVLAWSRQLFLRFYLSAAMPSFLRGHVEAFEFFGGVPRVLLYDNLKSAVLERAGDAIHFHPTLLELAAHYRYEPRPVAPARGNEKGRVERAIRYVRDRQTGRCSRFPRSPRWFPTSGRSGRPPRASARAPSAGGRRCTAALPSRRRRSRIRSSCGAGCC